MLKNILKTKCANTVLLALLLFLSSSVSLFSAQKRKGCAVSAKLVEPAPSCALNKTKELKNLVDELLREQNKLKENPTNYLNEAQIEAVKAYEWQFNLSPKDVHQWYQNKLKFVTGKAKTFYVQSYAETVVADLDLEKVREEVSKLLPNRQEGTLTREELKLILINQIDPEANFPGPLEEAEIATVVATVLLAREMNKLSRVIWEVECTEEWSRLTRQLRTLKRQSAHDSEIDAVKKQVEKLGKRLKNQAKPHQQKLDSLRKHLIKLITLLPKGFIVNEIHLLSRSGASATTHEPGCCGGSCVHCPFNRGLLGLSAGERTTRRLTTEIPPNLIGYQAEIVLGISSE